MRRLEHLRHAFGQSGRRIQGTRDSPAFARARLYVIIAQV
jgi:hypothetical protein